MIITWKQTKLGIFYPTNNGLDISRDLIKKHGYSFREAPYLESEEEAVEWARTRGYGSEFDFSGTKTYDTVIIKGLSLDDI